MKAYALLIFLVSLAVAEITGVSSSNNPGDFGNTGMFNLRCFLPIDPRLTQSCSS